VGDRFKGRGRIAFSKDAWTGQFAGRGLYSDPREHGSPGRKDPPAEENDLAGNTLDLRRGVFNEDADFDAKIAPGA
jgi:hypothetical protein